MTEQLPPSGPDYRRRRDEKAEKDEKDREKNEKGPSDRLRSATWALILIFAGFVLLLVTAGAFDWLDWSNAWSVVIVGAGLAVALEVVLRLLMPEYRRPVRGQIVLAVVLVTVGAASFLGWENVWPIVLIGVGLSMLIGAFTRRT